VSGDVNKANSYQRQAERYMQYNGPLSQSKTLGCLQRGRSEAVEVVSVTPTTTPVTTTVVTTTPNTTPVTPVDIIFGRRRRRRTITTTTNVVPGTVVQRQVVRQGIPRRRGGLLGGIGGFNPRRSCIANVRTVKRGVVNFNSLRGIDLVRRSNTILTRFAPICALYLEAHE
jgi:hypothetical protein